MLLLLSPDPFILQDAEVELLSRCLSDVATDEERHAIRQRLMVPNVEGLDPTGKPEIEAGQRMGMTVRQATLVWLNC
jgi:hypothetical protein